MVYKENYYPEIHFGGYSHVDGTVQFYTRVNALLNKEDVVLDIGCGRGEYEEDQVAYRRKLRILKGKVSKVIGVDYDTNASQNKYIDEFIHITEDKWPIEDQSINLILCDWVLEHIKDESVFLAEVKRVLKPQGYFCARTSNKYSYFAIMSRIIPNRLHSKILSIVQEKRKEEDVFPTFYKLNTKRKILQHTKKLNLFTVVYTFESEPSYLNFSKFFYSLGTFIHRHTPKLFRTSILVFCQKG